MGHQTQGGSDSVTLLDQALAAPECILSVMGDHAGEGIDAIFERKIADIHVAGRTFWVATSAKARPVQVQSLCVAQPGYVVFVEAATRGGARPTIASDPASEYSGNQMEWLPLPAGIGPVTGKIDKSAVAFVFDRLATDSSRTLDLWQYSDRLDVIRPVRFMLGCSTMCAVRADMTTHLQRTKSRFRRIVAVGALAEPYCVWLR
jgi:hypothetical protein